MPSGRHVNATADNTGRERKALVFCWRCRGLGAKRLQCMNRSGPQHHRWAPYLPSTDAFSHASTIGPAVAVFHGKAVWVLPF